MIPIISYYSAVKNNDEQTVEDASIDITPLNFVLIGIILGVLICIIMNFIDGE